MALEAQACGVPVVASRVGGLIDIIEENVTGIFAEPDDLTTFRKAIQELVDDSIKRTNMGASARKRIERNFEISNISQKIIELYKKGLA
jgi:glycosyltransferase involved in cell wall biosynthesis